MDCENENQNLTVGGLLILKHKEYVLDGVKNEYKFVSQTILKESVERLFHLFD